MTLLPAVSVVMPVRNGSRFLGEAVASVLAQTEGDLELVVVDDGSTDETPELLAAAARRDSRVRVVTTPPRGLTDALNEACAQARAPLLARMDADDVCLPDRLERQLRTLDARPDAALVAGGVVVVDEEGRAVDEAPARTPFRLLERNDIVHSTVLMRRSCFEEVGGYRVDHAEDYDLWLRLEERYELAAVAAPVLRYRLHPGQFSVGKLGRQAAAALAVRAAARRRRSGLADPLEGRRELRAGLLEELDVPAAEYAATVARDAVHWSATLRRLGRVREAELLVAAVAADAQLPVHLLDRRARLLRLRTAVRRGRAAETLRAAASAVGAFAPYDRGR